MIFDRSASQMLVRKVVVLNKRLLHPILAIQQEQDEVDPGRVELSLNFQYQILVGYNEHIKENQQEMIQMNLLVQKRAE
jgi:hypothetical protein